MFVSVLIGAIVGPVATANAGLLDGLLGGLLGWNHAPVAQISPTPTAYVSTPYVLNGSSSYDTDGRIVRYQWDTDNNCCWDITSTSPLATKTFTSSGQKSVSLRVTDDDGATSTDRAYVNAVRDTQPPVAVVQSPTTAIVGDVITIDGSGSRDSLGTIKNYSWDFQSDGVIDVVTVTPTVTHAWSVVGTYSVKLTVADYAGNKSSASTSIDIQSGIDETPEPPVGLSASDVPADEGGTIRLSWTANTESDVHRYRVYRAAAASGPYVAIADVTTPSLMDAGLVNGQLYSYAVAAVDDAAQEGLRSAVVSATPVDNLAPPVPAGLTATDVADDAGDAISVTWVEGPAADLGGHRVNCYDSVTLETVTIDVPADSASYTFTGLVTGRTYSFSAAAYDTSGNTSALTARVDAVPLDQMPPAVPAGLVARDVPGDEGGAIAVDWAANTDSDLAGYTLLRAELPAGADPSAAAASAVPIASFDAAATSFLDTTALSYLRYCYFLNATDISGNTSALSSAAIAQATDDVAPLPCVSVTAEDVPADQGGAVRVTWLASMSADAVGYRVAVLDDQGALVRSVDASAAGSIVTEGLTTGLEYSFSVTAFDAAGNESGPSSATATPVDNLAPSAPAGVSAADVVPDQGGSIEVRWSANIEPDLAGYAVVCRDAAGTVVATRDAGFATTLLFGDMDASGVYSFEVVAHDVNGNASESSTATGATAHDEIAPTPVAVSAADHPADQGGTIDVSWTASSASDVVGYKVYRDGEEIADVPGIAFADAEAGSVSHDYTVRAYDPSGNLSEPSTPTTVVAEDNLAPQTPAAPTAIDVAGDDSGAVAVAFAPVADLDVDGYRLYCYDPAGSMVSMQQVAALDTSAVFAGLADGIEYSFTVLAYDLSGNPSPESPATTCSAVDDVAPSAPTNLTAADVPADQGGAIALAWTASPEADTAGYRVYRDGDQVAEVADVTWTDLDAGAVGHAYTVAAFDEVSNLSPPSGGSSAQATDDLAPAFTGGVTALVDPAGGSISLTWSAVSDAAGYKVYRDGTQIADVAVAPFADNGLTNGTTYSYEVAAYDAAGNTSPRSAAITATPADTTAPSVPAGLSAADVPADQGGAISASWTANADDTTGYVARLYLAGSLVSQQTLVGTTVTFDGLTDGGAYEIGVAAVDAAGNTSAESSRAPATPADNVAPEAPAGLTAADTVGDDGGSIDLAWSAVSDAATYTVYRDGAVLASGLTGTTHTDTSAALGMSHTYTVTASDAEDNESVASPSATCSSADDLAPAAPADLSATPVAAGNAIDITWSAVSDAAGYKVYRDGTQIADVAVAPFADNGLANGATYSYEVAAYDAAGNTSPRGAAITATPADTTAPSVPAGLSAADVPADQGGAVSASWTANADDTTGYVARLYLAGSLVSQQSLVGTTVTFDGLTDGAAYEIGVAAVDAAGNTSAESSRAPATPADNVAPEAPAGLTAADTLGDNGGSIDLAWSAVADAATYTVYRDGTALAAGLTGTTHTDTTAALGVSHTYTVTASDAEANESAHSASATAASADDLAPATPADLSATPVATGNALTVSWSAVSDAAGYRVYRDGAQVADITTAPFTDTGLTSGVTYSYEVAAYDAAGNVSARSEAVVATPADNVAPATPAGLSASDVPADQGGAISASWTANADDTTGYVARLYLAGSLVSQQSLVGTTVTFDGLTDGAAYEIGVAAVDAAGNTSAESSRAPATPADNVAPEAPAGLTAADTVGDDGGSIDLAWTAVSDAATYTVYRDGAVLASGLTGTIHTDTSAALDVSHTYTVTASDAEGNESVASPSATCSSADDLAPAVPADLSATPVAAGNAVDISWSAVSDAAGYKVYRDGAQVADIATASFADNGLANGTTYSYEVAAYDAAGNLSARSTAIAATPADTTAPAVPAGLTAADVPADQGGAISASWTANTDDATGYVAKLYLAGALVTEQMLAETTVTFAGLTDGAAYEVAVAAVDAAGNTSTESLRASATPADNVAPAAPADLTATDTLGDDGGSIDLAWSAVADAATYTVYRDGTALAAGLTGTTHTDTTAALGVSHTYTVTASDAEANESAHSASATAASADDLAPAVPADLSATPVAAGNAVDISWSAVSDAAGYKVYRDGAQVADIATASFADNGLANGTTYSYEVAAYDAAGNTSPRSAAITATPADTTAPSVPAGLSAADVPADQGGAISASWTANTDDTTSYVARLYLAGSLVSQQILADTTVTFDGLTDGAAYEIGVAATDAAGNTSAESTRATATPADNVAPAAPAGMTAADRPTDFGDGLVLSWAPSADALGYHLYRSTTDGGPYERVYEGSATGTVDVGLTENTRYYYVVTAFDSAGDSAFSEQTDGTPLKNIDLVPPTAPGATSVTSGDALASLTWLPASDDFGVTGYEIWMRTGPTGTYSKQAEVTGLAYSKSALVNGCTYYFKLRALDAAGNVGPFSSELVANPAKPVGTPVTTRIEETSKAITYTGTWMPWSEPGLSGGSMTHTRQTGASASLTFSGIGVSIKYGGTEWQNRAMADIYLDGVYQTTVDLYSPTLTFQAVAFEASGLADGAHVLKIVNSGTRNVANTTDFLIDIDYFDVTKAEGMDVPATPQNVVAADVAADQGGSLRLSWNAVTSPNLAVYQVSRASTLAGPFVPIAEVTPPAASYIDSGLSNTEPYFYQVRAVTTYGVFSANSAVASAIALDNTAPVAPGGLLVDDNPGDQGGAIRVRWNASASTDVIGYRVYRSTTSAGTYALVGETSSTQLIDSGLANGTTFFYKVSAIDTANESVKTAAASAVARDDSAPAVPEGLSAVDRPADTGGAITVSWSAVADPDLAGYRLYRSQSPSGPWTQIAQQSTRTFTNTGLTVNGTYYYTVSSYDTSGNESARSAPASASALDNPPSVPGALTAADVTGDWGGSIKLTWGAVADTDLGGYRLYRSQSPTGPWTQIAQQATRTFTDTGLAVNGTYYYAVSAYDLGGNESPICAPVSAVALDNVVPGAVGYPTTLPGDGYVALTWAPASDNTSVAVYEIWSHEGTSGVYAKLADNATTAYMKTALANGTKRWFKVRARDAAGNVGAFSPETTAIPRASDASGGVTTRIEDTSPAISYLGAWVPYSEPSQSGGTMMHTRQTNASASFSFSGTNVSVKYGGTEWQNRAMVDIYIDGVYRTTVDPYSSTLLYSVTLYEESGLSDGRHTIKMVHTGRRNAANTTDWIVDLDFFDVTLN